VDVCTWRKVGRKGRGVRTVEGDAEESVASAKANLLLRLHDRSVASLLELHAQYLQLLFR